MPSKKQAAALAIGAALLTTLSGCGGGSDGAAAPNPPPTEPALVTLSGLVTVDQGIQNAVVCMDLNANSACDAGEPVSAKTGASGAYSLRYDPTKITPAQVAAASLIAPMVPGVASDPATTLDAARPGEAASSAAYVLRQAPGKSGAINPLTTLVAAGVAAGMTEASARANVATQLGIAEAKIDNYQDDANTDASSAQDTARTMAGVTAAALEAGATLEVGEQTGAASGAPGALLALNYADADNYFARSLYTEARPAGPGPYPVADVRTAKTNGVVDPPTDLYREAYLSSAGWTRCTQSVPILSTRGNPSRSSFCKARPAVGFDLFQSIAGQSMSSVVTAMQADPSTNTINSALPTTALLSDLGSATFPADARLQTRRNLNLAADSYLYINNVTADAFSASITSLEQLIASFASSAVNLATGRGTLGLGLADSQTSVLRVSFTSAASATAGTAQFYRCDYNPSANTIAHCVATQTGSYAIGTVNGVRVVRYSGFAPTIMTHTRLHAEVAPGVPGLTDGPGSGSRVFVVRENIPTVAASQSTNKRLDSTAWAAMQSQLGI